MDGMAKINRLVFEYINEHASKEMGAKFAKAIGPKNMAKETGLPSIPEMIDHLQKNNPTEFAKMFNGKRKPEEMNGHGPKAKKLKKDSDSSDESSSEGEDDTEELPKAPLVNGTSSKKDDSNSDSSSDESTDDEKES